MTGLLRLDQLGTDLGGERPLARVLALGQSSGALPKSLLPALEAYLRLEGLAYASRTRTGLRLERQALETGVRQAAVCLELAIDEAGAGIPDRMVQALGAAPLADLRRRGWEIAWGRLTEMRRESTRRCRLPRSRLLAECLVDLRLWATVVPESWSATDPGGATVPVDPRDDYLGFRRAVARAAFVDSLPRPSTARLLASLAGGTTFRGLLLRLAFAAGLRQHDLRISAAQARRFQRTAIAGGQVRPQVRDHLRAELEAHVARVFTAEEPRGWILADFEQAIEQIERGAAGDLGSWCAAADGLDQEPELLAAQGDPGARQAAQAALADLRAEASRGGRRSASQEPTFTPARERRTGRPAHRRACPPAGDRSTRAVAPGRRRKPDR